MNYGKCPQSAIQEPWFLTLLVCFDLFQKLINAHLGIVIWVFYYSINDLEHGSNSCATSNLHGQKTKSQYLVTLRLHFSSQIDPVDVKEMVIIIPKKATWLASQWKKNRINEILNIYRFKLNVTNGNNTDNPKNGDMGRRTVINVLIFSQAIWDDSSYHANVFLHIWRVSELFNGAAQQLREKRVTYMIYNTWPDGNEEEKIN